jgi:acetoin:2,6-dichlorophenolindophenol oxidoreductase subunit beta
LTTVQQGESAAKTAKPARKTMVEACRAAIREAMAEDESVFILGEDIGDAEGGGTFKVTKGLSAEFGTQRVRTTPISEQAIVGAAIGAAIAGLRPIAEIMLMNFTTVAMDQIVNHAAKLRYMSGGETAVPITIRTATGAGLGTGAQHSDMLEAWFAHVPGLKVVMPSSPSEAKGLLLSSIFDDDPVLFVEKKEMYGTREEVPEPGVRIPLGKANITRPGRDITIIGYGGAVPQSLKAAAALAADGIDAEVVDLRTISPWDRATVLDSVARTKGAVVVHEAVRQFGVGAEVSSVIHEELFCDLAAPVQRVASGNLPVPFSKPLEQAFLYSVDDITQAARAVLDWKR